MPRGGDAETRPDYPFVFLFLGVMTLAAGLAPSPPAVCAEGIESTYAEHTRGVTLARAGRHSEGLAVLLPLLDRFPDDYPLQRDIVLITIWKGDCTEALRRFERIRSRPDLEPYLVAPVSDCLLNANRPREARYLTRRALAHHPAETELQNAFHRADLALLLDKNLDEDSSAMVFELGARQSERNLAEWLAFLEGSAKIAEQTRLYARYSGSRTRDPAYRAGDFDRVGIGLRYRIDERLLLDQEVSSDANPRGRTGATTRLTHEPRDAWRLALAYASFSESVPLRARAAAIDARQWAGEVAYEAPDYRWEGLASINRYDFSDSNQRTAIYARLGYAYELRARREQRVYLEGYQSHNTLSDTAYFNPPRDHSIGLLHRTDFIYESRFRRHVDHLWLGASGYSQQGYGTYGRWMLGYEQDYDFDEAQALAAGITAARNVYDGRPETDWHLYLLYRRRY
jgi:hypothetical protein